jgi:hypothetical protein
MALEQFLRTEKMLREQKKFLAHELQTFPRGQKIYQPKSDVPPGVCPRGRTAGGSVSDG